MVVYRSSIVKKKREKNIATKREGVMLTLKSVELKWLATSEGNRESFSLS